MDEPEAPQLPPQLRKAPAERAVGYVLPASAAVWTAAEIMHWQGVPVDGTGIAAVLAAAVAWGASGRWGRIPRRVPWWIAAAGGWLTLSAAEGPLAGWPYAPLTWAWILAAGAAWWKARRHPAVLEAQEWRGQRAEWLSWRARRWGLGGSHLLAYTQTRLGEVYEVSTKGTGKRASAIAGNHTAELIAEDRDLQTSRVRVTMPRAGRVRISIRELDPWAKPAMHPLFEDEPQGTLAIADAAKLAAIRDGAAYSITEAPVIGQDPETGRPLEVPLWDSDTGGKNVFIVAQAGGGKTVVLDALSERITAAYDALQFRVNLSVKGAAEEHRWGPACHLTAFGTQQGNRAVRVLAVANGIIEWRAAKYATSQYDPSPEDPFIVVVVDEGDSAMAVSQAHAQLKNIATKGREYGVVLVRAGQRGTTDYGGAKIRSQDGVFLLGKINRAGEAYHAAGTAGFELPDMATYGEGHPGVWAVALLGGGHQLGRSWPMGPTRAAQAAAAARLARERAFTQPDLHPECRTFLGAGYEELLATDVFATWARDSGAETVTPAADSGTTPAGDGIKGGLDSPLAALAIAIRDAHLKADDETSEALLTALELAERDALEKLDLELDTMGSLDPADRERLAGLDAKNDKTRRMLAEAATASRPPDVSREALDAHTAARWQQVADAAQITPEQAEIILALLKTGTSISEVAKALDVTQWTARTYLERALKDGVAWLDKGPGGKGGRASRWRLKEPPGGDGT